MTEDELIERFEACDPGPDGFHHADHVRLTWAYLTRYSPIETLRRLTEGLRRFAASVGRPDRYHETMTWAYVVLVNERAAQQPHLESWAAFARANPDLLAWPEGALGRYYSPEALRSPLARRVFVLPDRGAPR